MPDPLVVPVPDLLPEAESLRRGERERPPSRRGSETISFKIQQQRVHLTIGRYPDDRVCEVFIAVGLVGADIRALLDSLAITASLYLQAGGSLSDLAAKWRHTHCEPSGQVVDGDAGFGITHATSVIDAVAQYLEALADSGVSAG